MQATESVAGATASASPAPAPALPTPTIKRRVTVMVYEFFLLFAVEMLADRKSVV